MHGTFFKTLNFLNSAWKHINCTSRRDRSQIVSYHVFPKKVYSVLLDQTKFLKYLLISEILVDETATNADTQNAKATAPPVGKQMLPQQDTACNIGRHYPRRAGGAVQRCVDIFIAPKGPTGLPPCLSYSSAFPGLICILAFKKNIQQFYNFTAGLSVCGVSLWAAEGQAIGCCFPQARPSPGLVCCLPQIFIQCSEASQIIALKHLGF